MLTQSDLQKIKQIIKKTTISKADAKNFFTKADAKNFATKDDLIGLAKSIELDELKTTFTDNLAKWKNELFTKIDAVLVRVKTAEEENIILNAREEGRQEEREGLNQRIGKLEAIHPNYHHQS